MDTIILGMSLRNTSVTEYFIQLANLLSKNFQVIIIYDHLENHPFELSQEIITYQWPSLGQPKTLKDFYFLITIVKKTKPKMMISNFSSVSFFLIVGYFMRVGHRVAWCHSISKAFDVKRYRLLRKRLIYSFATRIIANSKSTKNDLIRNFFISASKVHIIYNAVKKPSLKKLELNLNQILYVGGMRKEKGVEVLIHAIPAVVDIYPEVRFKIIGGNLQDERIKNFKKAVADLKIEKFIEFVGYKSKQEVLSEFSKSYVSIVPSWIEAFGYVVIESFSVKTPVIGSNTSGIAEIIRDGYDGFLFEPGNSADLSGKIIELMSKKELREKFSQNCYQSFLLSFELDSLIQNLSKTISDTIDNKFNTKKI